MSNITLLTEPTDLHQADHVKLQQNLTSTFLVGDNSTTSCQSRQDDISNSVPKHTRAQIHRHCLKIYPRICHKIILRLKSYDIV